MKFHGTGSRASESEAIGEALVKEATIRLMKRRQPPYNRPLYEDMSLRGGHVVVVEDNDGLSRYMLMLEDGSLRSVEGSDNHLGWVGD